MVAIKVTVNGQKLTPTYVRSIVSGSSNYSTIQFTSFSSEWTDRTMTAEFWKENESVAYSTSITNNIAVIPVNVLKEEGYIWFAIKGVSDDNAITSQSIRFYIEEGIIS